MLKVLYFAVRQGLSANLTEDNIKTVFTNYGQAHGMHRHSVSRISDMAKLSRFIK